MPIVSVTRKVFKSGQGLIMTIPKEFCEMSGVKRGDEVGVVFDKNQMVVIVMRNPKEAKDGKEGR